MRLFFVLIFLLAGIPAFAQNWREIKSGHFIVFYQPAAESYGSSAGRDNAADPEEFGREVLRKAEVYYSKIADDLGYQRMSEFWTWDKRVKIYIYPDHAGFVSSFNNPEWAGGAADYAAKTIFSYFGSKDFAGSILPHEIAHLIFRDFVGFKGGVPLWLDEGVAQWTEETKRQEVKKIVKGMLSGNGMLSMEDMMKLNVDQLRNADKVYIRTVPAGGGEKSAAFLTGNNLVMAYYVQAVSLVDFLIEKFGKNEFTDFCRALRDGKDLRAALVSVYGVYMHDLDDLDSQWKDYIENET